MIEAHSKGEKEACLTSLELPFRNAKYMQLGGVSLDLGPGTDYSEMPSGDDS